MLYDPARGTDEYFVVENRVVATDTYDQGLIDNGLVVWRVDERNYHPVGAEGEYLSLTRPDDGSPASSPGLEPDDFSIGFVDLPLGWSSKRRRGLARRGRGGRCCSSARPCR